MNGTSRFLIQKHHTEIPHFDLRLELGEVLKSWVLPKRIPYAVNEKRLAIEDAEVELNAVINMETIHDQYGVGRVELLDSGSYTVIEEKREKIIFDATGNHFCGRFVFLVPSWGRKTKRKLWTLLKTA